MASSLTFDEVAELFTWDLENGLLFNKTVRSNSIKIGEIAGSRRTKYHYVCINRKQHLVHHIIWLIANAEWPTKHIDHINGNSHDNRPSNLRLCTPSQNLSNRGKQRNNTSGYKGVSPNGQTGKWRVRINVNKKHLELGIFDSLTDAASAYANAAMRYHGEFART